MKHRCNHRLGSGPINPAPSVCQIGSLTRRVCSGLVAIFLPVVTRAAAKLVKPATPKGADVLSAPFGVIGGHSTSLHFSVLGGLHIERLFTAVPKPLKFCEIAAAYAELLGSDPSELVC